MPVLDLERHDIHFFLFSRVCSYRRVSLIGVVMVAMATLNTIGARAPWFGRAAFDEPQTDPAE